jgi:tetratricopeptide (TPR) repeat protein
LCDTKGLALNNLGKYNEAIEYYDKALQIDPKHAYPWNNKGNALNSLGKYEEAIKYIDKSLELNPDTADALYNKGLALNKLQGTKSEQRKIKSYTSDGKPVYE